MTTWTMLSTKDDLIKNKIEKYGVVLSKWDISINYGIKTGFNPAFVIDTKTKNDIVKADYKEGELIRPILRGRDIKRYTYSYSGEYLLCLFPSLKYNINDFPYIKEHLMSFGIHKLEQTGKTYLENGEKIKARKRTNNEWFETQDSIAYWDVFNGQVIAWQRITKLNQFVLTNKGDVVLDSMAFICSTKKYTLYLLALLNSSLMYYWMKKNVPQYGDNGFRLSNQFVSIFPAKKVSDKQLIMIDEMVNMYLFTHDHTVYKKIDRLIYNLYDFDNEEIQKIENEIR